MPQPGASKRNGHYHYFRNPLTALGTTGGAKIEDDIINMERLNYGFLLKCHSFFFFLRNHLYNAISHC